MYFFYHFHQSQKYTYTSLLFGRIAPKLFHLGQTFWVSFHKLSIIVCWNFGPLLLTELWMHIKAHLKHRASFFDIMGKSREINQDIRKRIVDLHKCGSSLGAISRCLKVPRSSVQTIIRKYKKHGNVQPSYRSGRRRILNPREEGFLV